MFQELRSRLSYANVMATIAVFLALGGGAYAIKLKRNSVGSKQIRPNAVKASEASESSFGTVPSATQAANAGTLDRLDSTAFSRKVVVLGRADPNATTAEAFFSWPEAGLVLRTDGDADDDNNVVVHDTNPIGGEGLVSVAANGSGLIVSALEVVAPGDYPPADGASDTENQLDTIVTGPGGRSIIIRCFFPVAGAGDDFCYGIKSGP